MSDQITLDSLGYGAADSAQIPAITSPTLGNVTGTGIATSTEERALLLLGKGTSAEQTAIALGVSPGRISQLLSQEDFASRVAEIRYESLQKHNTRDLAYDSLEDDLLFKLKNSLPLMVRPDTILKAISTVNGAKRRGSAAPDSVGSHTNIVTLVLPTAITQVFTKNIHNQVIEAGDQKLVTIGSGTLLTQMEDTIEKRNLAYEAKKGESNDTGQED